MKKVYVKIEGIHCSHCIDVITNEFLKDKRVKEIKIKRDIAEISYTGKIEKKEIINIIKNIDYITKEEYISENIKEIDNKIRLREFLIIIVVILLIWYLINSLFGYNIFNIIPNINTNITYGMLFVTGVLTSIHCISMCGAINLVAILDTKKNKNFKRPILYNLGRVISYTIIGGLIGLLGKIFSINETINGLIIITASIIMFLMSLSMLGIINFKLSFLRKIRIKNKSSNSFVIGLLNGLMPCGPLQAMEVYALTTGSFIKGAISMFLFSLGTVPLMLFVGIIFNLFKGRKRIIINKIASILILILSLIMLNRGLLKLNIDLTKNLNKYDEYKKSVLIDNYQKVEFDLNYNNYEDIVLQKGVPVKIIIHVDEKHLTGCNNTIISKDFNINKKLEIGDNEIEFTPDKTGEYTYTCWMEMIKNNIKVIDDKSYFEVK